MTVVQATFAILSIMALCGFLSVGTDGQCSVNDLRPPQKAVTYNMPELKNSLVSAVKIVLKESHFLQCLWLEPQHEPQSLINLS
jgi:hypothetical protein